MDLTALLNHPLVQSAVFPLALGFILTGVIRLIGGPGRGSLLAAAAIGSTLLATHLLIFGPPPLPPRSATEKLFLLTAAGLAAGFALDLIRDRQIVVRIVIVAGAAAGLWWLAGNRLGSPTLDEDWLRYGLVLAAGLVCLLRLESRSDDGLNPSVMLLVAAIGAGTVTVIGASAAIGQSLFGLAAALGGFMLWNWPVNRFAFNRAALLGAGLPFLFLVAQAAFFTRAPAAALALLIPMFFSDSLAYRLVRGGSRGANTMRPIVVGLLAAIPALAAAGVALWLGGAGDDLYR